MRHKYVVELETIEGDNLAADVVLHNIRLALKFTPHEWATIHIGENGNELNYDTRPETNKARLITSKPPTE